MKRTLTYGTSAKLADMEEGERGLKRDPNLPILSVMVQGKKSYLWIGNDAPKDKWCFATVSGEASLRRIAKSILAALDMKARKRSAP